MNMHDNMMMMIGRMIGKIILAIGPYISGWETWAGCAEKEIFMGQRFR